MDGTVHRLHGGVREKRYLVHRFDLHRGAGHGRSDIAILASNDARLLRGGLHLPHDVGARDLRVRALVPLDVERGKALNRRPHMVGDHRNGIIEAHHLAHALDRFGLAVIEAR